MYIYIYINNCTEGVNKCLICFLTQKYSWECNMIYLISVYDLKVKSGPLLVISTILNKLN